jgi:catalase
MSCRTDSQNYFAEVEQVAFSPSHIVPGIEPSADPVLQSRLFSYPDTHRHRLGTNYAQLPVNQPQTGYAAANFQRDGPGAFYNQGGRQAYLATTPGNTITFAPSASIVNLDKVHGGFTAEAVSYLSQIRPEDFNAPRNLWTKVFSQGERDRWIKTVSGHMSTVRDKEIIARQIGIFRAVHEDIATGLEKATGVQGHPGITNVLFNGSGNGYGDKFIPANGVTVVGGVKNNGAPTILKGRL